VPGTGTLVEASPGGALGQSPNDGYGISGYVTSHAINHPLD
jgi:hypothetical protein